VRFNSKMVRLRVARNAPALTKRSRVSIPKWCDWEQRGQPPEMGWTRRFQFQNGAIESASVFISSSLIVGFNSKMVRLRAKRRCCFSSSYLFQFQNGAIESHFYHTVLVDPAGSFNSKMVRLRVLTSRTGIINWKTFQFQNGAIESIGGFNRWYLFPSFNSKMVRLRGAARAAIASN